MTATLEVPTPEEVELVIAGVLGSPPRMADRGLLAACVARPAVQFDGRDAYPRVWDKAAALLHSVATSHCLREGNVMAGWAACWLLLGLNDHHLSPDLDAAAATDFLREVAADELTWQQIAERLPEFAL